MPKRREKDDLLPLIAEREELHVTSFPVSQGSRIPGVQ